MRFTPQTRHLAWMLERPIAHRGLHDSSKGIIENTASAFSSALAHRYAIECDLQLTRDGEAVVFHDDTLERLVAAHGKVIDRSASELQQMTITGSADRIQTLGQLLDQVAGKVPLIIELKTHWDGNTRLAERAAAVLSGYGGPFAVMSFDPDLMEAVGQLGPGITRGVVADRFVDDYYCKLPVPQRLQLRALAHLGRSRPHFVSYFFRELPFGPIQQIRGAGFPVITWTIRSKAEERQALRYSDQVTFEGYLA